MGQVAAPSQPGADQRHGTAGAALRNRNFRIIWLGMFASNIGTWMQTVVLPKYIDDRTESGTMVGLFVFAQLGPLLLLSIPGGVLADRFPRKAWIASMQMAALLLTLGMAWLVHVEASVWMLLFVQLVTGIANALNAPAQQGVVPALVDRRDLPGAISLNSVMINGSRVIGPVVAAALMAWGLEIAHILVINALTYLFIIASLKMVPFPAIPKATDAAGWQNFTTGWRIAARRTVLMRALVGMALFSFLCLPFVGLFPSITRLNLGLGDNDGATYKWLYATWGFGAMIGALVVGTLLARRDHRRLIAPFMLAFAASLAVFALLRSPAPAFPVGFALGFCYFAMTTCVMTVFQQNLRNSERARVMSLWFMAFGGTVSVGNLLFGPVIDGIGATPVLLMGSASAIGLAWFMDLGRRRVTTLADEPDEEPSDASSAAEQRQDALDAGDSTAFQQHSIAAGD